MFFGKSFKESVIGIANDHFLCRTKFIGRVKLINKPGKEVKNAQKKVFFLLSQFANRISWLLYQRVIAFYVILELREKKHHHEYTHEECNNISKNDELENQLIFPKHYSCLSVFFFIFFLPGFCCV